MVRRTKDEALMTRHRLLDAAEVLFQRQGVSHTSLQQIAQSAGATRGAIYWHFKDKADLFNSMMERVMLPLEAASHQASAGDESPLIAIERVLIQALSLMETDAQVRRVFEIATLKIEYTAEMDSVYQRLRSARSVYVADFCRALKRAARDAGIELPIPVKTAAHGLHAMISGLIQDWLLNPDAIRLVPAGRQIFGVYMAGLGFGTALRNTNRAKPHR
jgi:TetR/AcrR family transcriptional regulator, acrAB operon repressor